MTLPKAPPNLAEITYLCADGICVSICENDLLVPSDGPNQFNCGDYPSGDYPFATVCGQPCPQPPAPTDNLQQDCTNTVRLKQISTFLIQKGQILNFSYINS